jgi:HAE1 family hydrophobic/amphiphilic exporter-1
VPVYIRDIAIVEDSHEEVRQLVSVDGNPAVRMFVNKQSGANTVKVSDAVWEEVADIHRDYPDVSITASGDSAEFIKRAIHNVSNSAWQGALLAVLVLLFFLASFSSAVIIGIAIPVSVISTFALMYFNGFTLNTVSFGGLALGVGMLVDNAIVVLENIVRHREEGKEAREAAIVGSREVGLAITASTLTTIAVFVPVVFIQGVSAVTFQQLAYVVSFSLVCSLVVALTIVPLLCSRYLSTSRDLSGRGKTVMRLFQSSSAFIDRVSAGYGRLIGWALGHPKAVLGSAAALFAVSLYLAPLIGVELQPEVDEGELRANVELEPGTRVEVTNEIMGRLERVVREHVPEVKTMMTESGGGGFQNNGQNTGELRIRLVDRKERTRSVAEIASILRREMLIEPAMLVRISISSGMYRRASSSGSQGGDRLSVEVRGHDLATLETLAERVQEVMSRIPGVADVQISRRPGLPEMVVEVDRDKASTLGLNVSDVADTFRTAVGGRRSSMYREEGDEYNILIRLQEADRLALPQIGEVALTTATGRTISAQSVVNMRRQEGPVSIERKDQERIIIVSGTPEGRDLGSIIGELDEDLRQIDRPEGYAFAYGGEYEDQQKSFRDLTFAAILALVLVYMVMAAQFESWRDPFIVLFSIPLASVGVVLTLLLTGTTFNMQAFLGVIILVGIVVNNAIVLIDYINLLRREHNMELYEAIVTSGSRRLRPILMTTITTVLGLVPMGLGLGEGGELQAPLARTVIGGLTTSTLITLVLIPVVYMLVERRREPAAVSQPLTPAIEPAGGD